MKARHRPRTPGVTPGGGKQRRINPAEANPNNEEGTEWD